MTRRAEHHGALTVGDRVVQLDEQGRPAALQPLEQGDPPQRPREVEVGHGLAAGLVEDLVPAARLGHPEPAHVEGQVELRVHDDAAGS